MATRRVTLSTLRMGLPKVVQMVPELVSKKDVVKATKMGCCLEDSLVIVLVLCSVRLME